MEKLKGNKISFLDPKHGFWRLGVVYKEDKKWLNVRDVGGSRYRIPNNPECFELQIEQEKSAIKKQKIAASPLQNIRRKK